MVSLYAPRIGDNLNINSSYTAIALGAIGGVLLPQLSTFAAWIRLHFIHRSKLWRYQHAADEPLLSSASISTSKSTFKNKHSWALVTGASDGIGLGFVQELASRNFNVILHGRNAIKLAFIITDLEKQYPNLHFEPFILDATDRSSWTTALNDLVDSLKTRNINLTVLVNNVGGNPINALSFTPLSQIQPDHLNSIIDMNAIFPAQLTRALLPILANNKPSLILNMSSATATMPVPYLVPYNGSKSFNSQFSRTLRLELVAESQPEIEVMAVQAAAVQSAGLKLEKSLFVPTSRAFAKNVLRMVGCGRDEVVGWWVHSAQIWLARDVLPRWVMERIVVKAGSQRKQIWEEENGGDGGAGGKNKD